MASGKIKILICVEGEKTDVNLMERLLSLYNIDADHEIVSYKTNIYVLYNEMFSEESPENMDLLQVLKEKERDEEKKRIFDENYSDILLVFDMDPQDPYYAGDKLRIMTDYFTESTDHGRLYLNFPMVESFHHMKTIPDDEFFERKAELSLLKDKQYKALVRKEGRGYSTKAEYNHVILQNIAKAWKIIGREPNPDNIIPSLLDILIKQIDLLEREKQIAVLCCCVFFIAEYNHRLLLE